MHIRFASFGSLAEQSAHGIDSGRIEPHPAVVCFGRALILIAMLIQAGCVDAFDGYLIRREAALQFSVSNSCPRNRVVIGRVAIDPRDLFEAPLPPPEIAADRERLNLWISTSRTAPTRLMTTSAVSANGCGVHITYVCWQEWSSGDDHAQHRIQQCHDVDLTASSPGTIGGLRLKPNGRESLRRALDRSPID